jgi:hypothetical protein
MHSIAEQTPAENSAKPYRVALGVRGGLHDGASIDLPDQPMCVVGSARHADVILRDASVATEHIAITRDHHGVHVRALASGFGYDERVIAPGDSIIVPSTVENAVIVLGGITLNIQQMLPRAKPDTAHAQASPESDESTLQLPVVETKSRGRNRLLTFGLLGTGVLLTFAAFAISVSESMHEKAAKRIDVARHALAIPQLAGVKADEKGAKVVVSGFVANEEEKALLNAQLKPGMVDSLQVHVGADLASRAKDLLRLNGQSAVTSYQPHGKVLVSLTGADKQVQDRLADIIKKDLPMIAAVSVVSTPSAAELAKAAGPGCVNPEADRDALRFVAVFASEPAFVRTGSGNKYYVGSKLPTGHEISAIRENEIVLECVGKFTTISL